MVVKTGKDKGKVKCKYQFYFHSLRHSYATYLLEKGVDIMTISELLGHNQVTTTQIYARVSNVQKAKAVEDAFSSPLMEFRPSNKQYGYQETITSGQLELEKMRLEVINKQLEIKKLELMREKEMVQFNPA
jgi:hypothetical protein